MKWPNADELMVPVTRLSILINSLVLMFWGVWYLAPCVQIAGTADASTFIERFGMDGYYGLVFAILGLVMVLLSLKNTVKSLSAACFIGFVGWIAAGASIVAYDYTAPGVPIAFFAAAFFAYGYISLSFGRLKRSHLLLKNNGVNI